MKGDATPTVQEQSLIRTKDLIELLNMKRVNSTTTVYSGEVQCTPFRKFGLYVYIKSTSTPTTIRLRVEFLDAYSGRWHTYKQGLFASLFWEDTETASGIAECFKGDVLGRAMRIAIDTVGTTSTKYFDVTLTADFWN